MRLNLFLIILLNLVYLQCKSQEWLRLDTIFQEQWANKDFKNLIATCKKSVEAAEIEFGDTSLVYLASLTSLCLVYNKNKMYLEAIECNMKSLDFIKKCAECPVSEYESTLTSIALNYVELGEFNKAVRYWNQLINYYELTDNLNNQNYYLAKNKLGETYRIMGLYDKSLPWFQEALNIKTLLGDNHVNYGTVLNNFAQLYQEMGIYDKALAYYQEDAKIILNNYGKNDPNYAICLNNVSTCYRAMGDYNLALNNILEAIEITKSNYGTNHPDYLIRSLNLASIYQVIGQNDTALKIYKEVLNNFELLTPKSYLLHSEILNNIGLIYYYQGEFYVALTNIEQSLANISKTIGKQHPQYGFCLSNLAGLYQKIGDYDKVLPLIQEAIENTYFQINQNFSFLSEKEKEQFYSTVSYNFNAWQSFFNRFSIKKPEIGANSYDLELANKGLILQAGIQMRNVILNSGDQKVLELFDEWTGCKNILAKEYSKPILQRRSDFNEIEEKANSMEAELTKISSSFTIIKKTGTAKYQEIQANLGPNDVAIEFSSFRYRNNTEWTDSSLYVANILRKNDPYPYTVYLCERNQLDSLLERKINKESSLINKIYSDKRIYELIWKPIESYLKKDDRIYFSPSGLLNQISLSAIATTDSTYISDEYLFNQMNTTGILTFKDKIDKPVKDIAIFGGIDFDASDEHIASIAKDIILNEDIVSRSLYTQDSTRSGKWTYLNGTLDEAQRIDKMAKSKNIESKLFSGAQAIEEQFKSLSGNSSPSVIHIATHGFFFPDPKIDKKKLEMMSFQQDNRFTLADNPMNRSGLLFAGSNKAWSGEEVTTDREDGILTAYEVSNLSLFNTELVVLSACETGLGDIKGSEGVYGLQRAFKQAGVRYLMMSLWKVPDNATKEFMTTFYTEYLNNQKPIREAFNKTQSKMKEKYRNEPYKWGGFVLME